MHNSVTHLSSSDICELALTIDDAWQNRDSLNPSIKNAVTQVIAGLENGSLRVAEKVDGNWQVNQWVKKAVLLSFRIHTNVPMQGNAYDKVPLKFTNWCAGDFEAARIRAVPGSLVRSGSFIGTDVVLTPSFVNIGAYVDQGTMVDSYVTVGSCAQIGKNCHLSMNVGIGGVLEPLQANPVIIEDNCFIGAGSQIVEGVIVEQGAVIGMNVALGAGTPIVNRQTGDITYGRIPPFCVVLNGMLPPKVKGHPLLPCAVIVKQVDASTRAKTAINELLRPE
jgi:2,3,4,5-tetrahydropyridine-2-carboxylate N-succinyltransferase